MSGNEGISLVRQWFQNAIEGKINESVLFINNMYNPSQIISFEQRYKYKNANFNVKIIDDLNTKNTNILLTSDQNNIFLIGTMTNSITQQQYQNLLRQTYGKKILYFKTSLYLGEIIQQINSDEYNNIAFNIAEIESISLEYLLKNHRNINVADFLVKELQNRQNILSLNGSVEMRISINELTWLQDDINILQNCNILTARLAVILYRFTFLDINANHTLIGRYIHKICGVRSKTMNRKYSALKNYVLSDDLIYKNFKAYDLSRNESDIAIREEIAAELLNLQIKQLDIETVARATRLTIERIEKLKKKM